MRKKKSLIRFMLLFIIAFFPLVVYPQKVTLAYKNVSFEEVLNSIKKQTNLILILKVDEVDVNRIVSINVKDIEVHSVMQQLLLGSDLGFEIRDRKLYLFKKRISNNNIPPNTTANSKTITGIVTDSKTGEPIVGANVIQKGTTNGTISDLNGKYSLRIPSDAVLSISYMGYNVLEINTSGKTSLNISLQEDIKSLDEVVVIGYQDVKKKDLTGSVSSANVSEMIKAPVSNIDQALAGRVAGVMVTSGEGMPGQSMNIVIRGNNSITQDNSPLYIIDGFPSENSDIVSSINPRDIESIDILKDASATAIYGSRGANGVVIITTKKGKMGELNIVYDGSIGVQRPTKKIPLMDAYEFVRLQEELYPPTEMTGEYGYFKTYEGKTWTLEDYKNIEQYDWQDLIFRDAMQQNHSVSLTGGNVKNRYNASISYTNQDGIIIKSNYSRIQGRLGLNIRRDKLNISLNTNYSSITNLGFSPSLYGSSSMLSLFYNVWGYRPVTQPGVNIESLIESENDDAIQQSSDATQRFNPFLTVNNEHRKNNRYYVAFNGFADYELLKDLRLKISGNYTRYGSSLETFFNSKTRSGSPISINKVNSSIFFNQRYNLLNENTLTYNKKFHKDHYISSLVGNSFQVENSESYGFGTRLIPNESLGMAGMAEGEPFTANSSRTEWSMISYFLRLNYRYRSKYYITGTYRVDGSSKFAKNNRFGFFPSVAVAWNFTEEPFFEGFKDVFDLGKLRFSWGKIGNNRIGPYDTYARLRAVNAGAGTFLGRNDYISGIYPFNNLVGNKGPIPINLPNKDLKWETTTQTNLGLDLTMLKDRISLIVDLYSKKTTDLLLNSLVPFSSGYGGTMKNIGSVQNKGIEFTINANIMEKHNFKWAANFNIAFNKNKVLSLAENQLTYLEQAMISQEFASPNYIVKVGYPLGMMYGYLYAGTYKLDDFVKSGNVYVLNQDIAAHVTAPNPKPGDQRFVDINGDGVVDNNDMTFIGRGTPIHIGGFNNTFEYKGFDLSVFLQWSYGSDVLNGNRLIFETGRDTRNLNRFASYVDRWSFENQDSDIPCISAASTNNLISTRVIEDGSFLRLKTLSLGYKFGSKLLKRINVNSVRVYISGENLITWSKYSGYDPEVSVRNSAITPNVDFSSYPRALSFNSGLTVNF
ncbi:MAG: TonB-dependent receptor [Fermentimonas sp.]|jgi:TonB-linked SusC/RagA family outer membrane protein